MVADLIAGFETPYGMELLATVHWIADHEGAKDAAEAVESHTGEMLARLLPAAIGHAGSRQFERPE